MDKQQQSQFIANLGKYTVKHYNEHKILPSMTIAQGILESNWGTSELAVKAYNYFGMKWSANCGCDYYEKKTAEQKPDGSYYTVVAKFRKYKNMEKGFAGYYDFLDSKPWYDNLKGVTDYKEACKLIKQDGWATSLSYTDNLIKLIEKHNLYVYDELALHSKANATVVKKCNIYPSMNDWEPKVITLSPDSRITILKDVGNGWSKAQYELNVGFVKNSAITVDKGVLSAYKICHTTSSVALRTDRVVSRKTKVMTLPASTKFIFLGKDAKWVKCKYQGKKYYLWKAKTSVK